MGVRIASRSAPPHESAEQFMLFEWAALQCCKYPELSLLYHVPNGGKRDAVTAHRLRREGVKPGVPDICLPVPRSGYGALYIELKRTKGGRLSDNQRDWIDRLREAGNRVEVCKGFEEARKMILRYLDGTERLRG